MTRSNSSPPARGLKPKRPPRANGRLHVKALNLIRFAIAGLCAAAVAACESAPLPTPQQAASVQTDSADGYRLGTGDEIKVTVFDEPQLSGPLTVDGLGSITMNLAGQIQVKNLTPQE